MTRMFLFHSFHKPNHMVSRKTEQLKLKSYLPGFHYIAKIIVYVILFFFRLLGDFSLDSRTLAKLQAKSITFFDYELRKIEPEK